MGFWHAFTLMLQKPFHRSYWKLKQKIIISTNTNEQNNTNAELLRWMNAHSQMNNDGIFKDKSAWALACLLYEFKHFWWQMAICSEMAQLNNFYMAEFFFYLTWLRCVCGIVCQAYMQRHCHFTKTILSKSQQGDSLLCATHVTLFYRTWNPNISQTLWKLFAKLCRQQNTSFFSLSRFEKDSICFECSFFRLLYSCLIVVLFLKLSHSYVE